MVLKIDSLPPSLINKLRTEPAEYIGTYDVGKREEYTKQTEEKISRCEINIKEREDHSNYLKLKL